MLMPMSMTIGTTPMDAPPQCQSTLKQWELPVVSVQTDTHKPAMAISQHTGPQEDIPSPQLIKVYQPVFLNKREVSDSHSLQQLLSVHCYNSNRIVTTKAGTLAPLSNSPCTVVACSSSQCTPSKEATLQAMVIKDEPWNICKTKATIGVIN